jgi:hypothetical protein
LYKICRRSGKIGETEIIWRRRIKFKAVDDDVCKKRKTKSRSVRKIKSMANIKKVTSEKVMLQFSEEWPINLMSVCPCIVDDMKRVKPTRCYTMVY